MTINNDNKQCLNVYGMFKLSEYWTRARCNIVHLLQGKEVRSVYFFSSTQSLFLRDVSEISRRDGGWEF